MQNPSFINLPYTLERDPPPFEGNAIKYPETLVRYFLKNHTKRKDLVFDPFAGLGTTLFVAEDMGRVPYGVEYDDRRHQWVAGQLNHWTHLVHGDAFKLDTYGFPKMDFCMSSPPFMKKNEKWNPLYAGNPDKAGYDIYLKRMGQIYKKIASTMKRSGTVIVHADNLPGRIYTPLVRDLSLVISKHLHLIDEKVIVWADGPRDYPHTHCLVFKA